MPLNEKILSFGVFLFVLWWSYCYAIPNPFPKINLEDKLRDGQKIEITTGYGYGWSKTTRRLVMYFPGNKPSPAITFKSKALGYPQFPAEHLPPGATLLKEAECVFTGVSDKGTAVLQLTNTCTFINRINELVFPKLRLHFKIEFFNDVEGVLRLHKPVLSSNNQSRFKSDGSEAHPIPNQYPNFDIMDFDEGRLEKFLKHVNTYFADPFDTNSAYGVPRTPLPFVANIGVAYTYSIFEHYISQLGNISSAILYMEEYNAFCFQTVKFVFSELRSLELNVFPAIYFAANSSMADVEMSNCYKDDSDLCLEQLQHEITKWQYKDLVHAWSFQQKIGLATGIAYVACACNSRINPCVHFVGANVPDKFPNPHEAMHEPWVAQIASHAIAHELGHNFGILHDFHEDHLDIQSCPAKRVDGNWIMSYDYELRRDLDTSALTGGGFPWLQQMLQEGNGLWSLCSRNTFNAYLLYLLDEDKYCFAGK